MHIGGPADACRVRDALVIRGCQCPSVLQAGSSNPEATSKNVSDCSVERAGSIAASHAGCCMLAWQRRVTSMQAQFPSPTQIRRLPQARVKGAGDIMMAGCVGCAFHSQG